VAAERALRLEIAEQYPDLAFGPTLRTEVDESHELLGLPLGVELPLFSRNQQGVAEALGVRSEARARYEVACSRALAALEHARRALDLAIRRRADLESGVLPQAQASVDLMRRALAAGSAGALDLLTAERSEQEVRLEVLAARRAEHAAWAALEAAVGEPLRELPGAGREAPVPAALAEPLLASHEEGGR
jgi:cobalt-zinc-cadmium efflux system outer membrane protein